jgi:hypothetical protein
MNSLEIPEGYNEDRNLSSALQNKTYAQEKNIKYFLLPLLLAFASSFLELPSYIPKFLLAISLICFLYIIVRLNFSGKTCKKCGKRLRTKYWFIVGSKQQEIVFVCQTCKIYSKTGMTTSL